jgi:hypothetical protein
MAVDDAYTVALLHMNGADASTTFTDESGKSWTANGNAQIDTAQSVFGGASGLFDGTGDYLSASDSDDWRLDGGNNNNAWTIDFWVRFASDPLTGLMGLVMQRLDNSNHWGVLINSNSLQFLLRDGGSVTINITNSWNPEAAIWYHVAVVKDGANGYMMFINGTQIGSTQTDTTTIPNIAGGIMIANYINTSSTSYPLNGWLDELRISKGVARWTSNFTPPTAQYGTLPAISGFWEFF